MIYIEQVQDGRIILAFCVNHNAFPHSPFLPVCRNPYGIYKQAVDLALEKRMIKNASDMGLPVFNGFLQKRELVGTFYEDP